MLDALTISRPRPRNMLWAIVLGVAALVVASSAVTVWLSSRASGDSAPRVLSQTAFVEETGVKILRIAVVGGGGILDVRYQVHAEHGASSAQHGDLPIALLDEETGLLLADGVHGRHAASSNRPEAVRYVLLSNTGGALKRGETASVVVGDVRLEHVPVQ